MGKTAIVLIGFVIVSILIIHAVYVLSGQHSYLDISDSFKEGSSELNNHSANYNYKSLLFHLNLQMRH